MEIGVLAHGRYVPEEVIPNSFFDGKEYRVYTGEGERGDPRFAGELVELSEEKILKNTGGIRERRRIAEGDTTVDFVERAFEKTGFPVGALDGIVVGTISNERKFPSVACQVQERIGAENVSYAVDVCAACSGFLHGLDLAWQKSRSDFGSYLVAGVELLTRITDYREINCDLFGDGCGVMVIGPSAKGSEIIATHFESDVSGIGSIFSDRGGVLRMPSGKHGEGGRDVLKKATKGMVDIAHKLLDKTKYRKDDVALYIPHQANGRIVEGIRRRMAPNEGGKVYQNIEMYGNMSAGTVPFAFSEAVDGGRVGGGDLVMLLSAGAGLALGGALLRV